ncbi:MAG: porphobilinogen synthase [Planctomycetes bacterium]|nr:porphobilinogen synthase [Planctomycetota bacterium]
MPRSRRLRRSDQIRGLTGSASVNKANFIYPLFAIEGKSKKEAISSLPGQYRYTLDILKTELKELKEIGLNNFLIFGVVDNKDQKGSYALTKNQIVAEAVKLIKDTDQNFLVFTDICLCGYTDHGHCGLIKEKGNQLVIDNDETVKLLGEMAVIHAKAGADFAAPSAMMDFQVKGIRAALDNNTCEDTGIMSYSAKFLSAFYGPFREATGNTPKISDRSTYQLPVNHGKQAITEIGQDIDEGADIVMVKPAVMYLDIINEASKRYNAPIAAYHVSGEYAMIKAAVQKGWLDEKRAVLELFTSIKRAGADIIISYYSKEAAKWL